MKQRFAMAGLSALVALAAACNKEKAPEGQTVLPLDGLPEVTALAPTGTRVARNAVGLGVMLKGPDVSVTIGEQVEGDPRTLDEAKKNAEAYKPKDMKEEKLSDGFILTYANEGNMGTNYWLVGRRLIDGRSYSCGVSSPKQEHQASAIAICKSLKKK